MSDTANKVPNEKILSSVTGVILSIMFVIWLLTFFGKINFDANIFFFSATAISGIYFFIEKKFFLKYLTKDKDGDWERPWWLSWTSGMFIILFIITIFRGFVVEPFRIPSGSMFPTIEIGDVATITKFYYDVKIPIVEKTIVHVRDVQRGDIVVFRYPKNPSVYYIKRFVGLPNDQVEFNFVTRELKINNKTIERSFVKNKERDGVIVSVYKENLNGIMHDIELNTSLPDNMVPVPTENADREHCFLGKNLKKEDTIRCSVPKDHYFAMGDNRDNSADSRFWGFVPKENIVGRAQAIIISSHIDQIGLLK